LRLRRIRTPRSTLPLMLKIRDRSIGSVHSSK
jgi:hypothetical protein